MLTYCRVSGGQHHLNFQGMLSDSTIYRLIEDGCTVTEIPLCETETCQEDLQTAENSHSESYSKNIGRK